jgi:hypothetical protein
MHRSDKNSFHSGLVKVHIKDLWEFTIDESS